MTLNLSAKRGFLFLLILLAFSVPRISEAQAPEGLNYQAIARNIAGAIIPSQSIGLRLTVTNGSGGATLYQETQTTSTNQFGLFTINVGSGSVVSGSFSAISWGTVTPWLQVEMDPTGGTSYINMGTSQLLSVPYALFAASGNPGPQGAKGDTGATGPQGPPGTKGDTGAAGPQGPPGAKGDTGVTGPQGTQGPQGAQGSQGSQGPQGPQGPQGAQGSQGPAGSANISGTTNYLIKFTAATTGGNSLVYDNGTDVGIGTTSPAYLLDVTGSSATSVSVVSNTNAAGIGLAGQNTAATGSGAGSGVFGQTQQSGGVGVLGGNLNSSGVGVLGVGNDVGYTLPSYGAGGAFFGTSVGAYCFTSTTTGYGVYGKATDPTSAYGVVGAANGVLGAAPSSGAGGAFFGYEYGMSAVATDQNLGSGGDQSAGGYFVLGYDAGSSTSVSTTLVEAASTGGTHYKIWSSLSGLVSTSVPDLNDQAVTMHAPETPECYFQDYGQGKLINGKAHITIDPILAKNVTINDKHPLRAFVQLEGNCNGVYITNKTTTGFDVVELAGGTSNVDFQWSITCNMADAKFGKSISPFADLRFEAGPVNQLKNLSSKEQPASIAK